ncbi:2,5-dichloro-2,5-cyclohexadiene-1,4-diol dehydrogenase LinX-like [Tachypleus tridentatus]|uniref:2,5-dichloro-2,5-cyclohexadiene-1,4-diol dehydrogenase LinX-like n=1 Tax=Tachypleus tridentatus TaxID=6853 RepID=UPI003FD6563E
MLAVPHLIESKGSTVKVSSVLGKRGTGVEGGQLDNTLTTPSVNPMVKKEAAESYPHGRIGQPQEVANAIAFLASNEALYITGETLVIDGATTISFK